jgi:hypothetical protein
MKQLSAFLLTGLFALNVGGASAPGGVEPVRGPFWSGTVRGSLSQRTFRADRARPGRTGNDAAKEVAKRSRTTPGCRNRCGPEGPRS